MLTWEPSQNARMSDSRGTKTVIKEMVGSTRGRSSRGKTAKGKGSPGKRKTGKTKKSRSGSVAQHEPDSSKPSLPRSGKSSGGTTDTTWTPTASNSRRRQVQQSIKDHFPVRRSTRRCKTVLEDEEFEHLANKLRNCDEEGLKVVEVEGKGRGVVSTRPFRRGELVCEYSGELISHKEAKKREEEYSSDTSVGCYMYYFTFKTKKLCVDATKDNGRFGRLLNHSKTASNVVTKLYEVDSQPYLCLMAARDIQPGEELQYDYGERSSEALLSHPWLAS